MLESDEHKADILEMSVKPTDPKDFFKKFQLDGNAPEALYCITQHPVQEEMFDHYNCTVCLGWLNSIQILPEQARMVFLFFFAFKLRRCTISFIIELQPTSDVSIRMARATKEPAWDTLVATILLCIDKS